MDDYFPRHRLGAIRFAAWRQGLLAPGIEEIREARIRVLTRVETNRIHATPVGRHRAAGEEGL